MKEVRAFINTASLTELEKAKQEVLDLLKEKGLTLEDLQDITSDKRTKVAPKYRMELNGEVIEWTGRGRRPKAFEGVELEKYLAK